MKSTTFRVDSSGFESSVQEAIRTIGRGTPQVVKRQLDIIGAESLAEVPIDTGTLAASQYKEIHATPEGVVGEIGYGRGGHVNPKTGRSAESYMIEVHENLDKAHPSGKAKFLEDPINRHANTFVEDVATDLLGPIQKLFRG